MRDRSVVRRWLELSLAVLVGCHGCGGSGSGTRADAHPPAPPPVPAPPPAPPSSGPLPAGLAVDASRMPTDGAARCEHARRLFVAPTGDDAADGSEAAPLRSIRRALEQVGDAGDATITVAAGTYREGDAEDYLALRMPADGTCVTTRPGEAATVEPAGASLTYGLELTGDHCTWRGVSLRGFRSNGISLGREGDTLRDIVVADTTVEMPAGGDGIAAYPDHRASGTPVLEGVALERVTVRNATIGITVGAGPARDVALRGVTVVNSPAEAGNTAADAIAFESGENVLIDGADVSGAGGDGIDLKSSRVSVLRAVVHGVARNGIKIWRGGDVIDCVVTDTGADAAIVFEDGAESGPPLRYRLVHSVVAFHNRASGGEPAYVMSVGYEQPSWRIELEIVNSVFYRNAGGIVLSRGTTLTARNNLFHRSGTGQVLEWGWDGSAGRVIEESAGPDALAAAGTVAGNLPFATVPGFTDPEARAERWFVPVAESPLLDAGVAVEVAPATDLLGGPRPRGAAPDVGPVEVR